MDVTAIVKASLRFIFLIGDYPMAMLFSISLAAEKMEN